MTILVSGSTGLVGMALVNHLEARGDTVVRLVRREAAEGEIAWDPQAGTIDTSALSDLDGVVHLAGENIAAGRWNDEKKARIRDSRVDGTELLARSLSEMETPPEVVVSASAIGYYGDRGDEILDENSAQGEGFLPDTCQAWERAAAPAVERGIRVVHPRIGVVLTKDGGALGKMLLPFKMGVGGVIGTGDQFMSWVTLDDLLAIITHCLSNKTISGPINAVSPNPCTNREFTKSLGRVLSRPTLFPMPAFAARLAFGEMADALLLSSSRVHPTKLAESRYNFVHPELESGLRYVLGK
jgi:uncharacterized protein (TIGR01777 family)